jgi:L-2-hydroxyglutarate oxidase LhgO
MAESINTIVIGGGVIGLACARAIALQGREVIVLEQHETIGQETSSRNSEVIHAGIYYPTDSLKARLSVAGKSALYAYCSDRGIPHRRLGKLIVATHESDTERLRALETQARANGVSDLRWLDADGLAEAEPAVTGHGALLSPSSGIVDSHALMLALQGDLEAAGGLVALQSNLVGAAVADGLIELSVDSAGAESRIRAEQVVNCAGLHGTRVAQILHGGRRDIPQTRYARGAYFEYAGQAPFSRLIYPLPEPGGLGIHATVDIAGALRFGPAVEWIDTIDYSVDPGLAPLFAKAIAAWWPGLDATKLSPAYAGIRPKLVGPGAPAADFHIVRTARERTTLVDLLGIESPGLTSCLTIAEYVRELLGDPAHDRRS